MSHLTYIQARACDIKIKSTNFEGAYRALKELLLSVEDCVESAFNLIEDRCKDGGGEAPFVLLAKYLFRPENIEHVNDEGCLRIKGVPPYYKEYDQVLRNLLSLAPFVEPLSWVVFEQKGRNPDCFLRRIIFNSGNAYLQYMNGLEWNFNVYRLDNEGNPCETLRLINAKIPSPRFLNGLIPAEDVPSLRTRKLPQNDGWEEPEIVTNESVKPGMVVECIRMQKSKENLYDRVIEPGTRGVVDCIEDAGSIHVIWDNGSRLALLPEADIYRVVGQRTICPRDKKLMRDTLELLRKEVRKSPDFAGKDWKDADDWLFARLCYTKEELHNIYEGSNILVYTGSAI